MKGRGTNYLISRSRHPDSGTAVMRQALALLG